MLQAAEFFSPLVSEAQNSECQIYYFLYAFSLYKSVEASLRIFIFCTLGTSGLKMLTCVVNHLCDGVQVQY